MYRQPGNIDANVRFSEQSCPRVLMNCLSVAVLFLAPAAGATDLDRRLDNRRKVEACW
jgi:hypothetical protein